MFYNLSQYESSGGVGYFERFFESVTVKVNVLNVHCFTNLVSLFNKNELWHALTE
jgi:hypothetical protein